MPQKMLITQFNYSLSHDEFRSVLDSVADAFTKVPGCVWKIWLIDEEKNEGGAVYLFNDAASLEAFKNSELVASVRSHPALSNFHFRETDIVKGPSEVTKAPLVDMAMA